LISPMSLLLSPLIERVLNYQHLCSLIIFCSWYLRKFNVALWVYWFLFYCFHLDQYDYVIGLSQWEFMLPCSVQWLSLARITLCRVYSGMFASVMLICNYHSMLLSLIVAMVLVSCAQMHGFLGVITVPCGWFLTSMMIFLVSPTAAWVAIFEIWDTPLIAWVVIAEVWGPPLFWLSLPLDRLTALRQEPLWCRCCWQLLAFQIGRDEVTGKTLFVDEDLLSETSLFIYFEVSRGGGRVACCFLVQVLGLSALGCCR